MTSTNEVTIYVVDDEPLLLQLAEELLAGRGYRLCLFSDPKQAWEAFAAAMPPPALVITDFMMPGMTGVELLTRCRTKHPSVKTMLLSGTVRQDALGQLPIRLDRFLQKPCPPGVFAAAVGEVLAGQG